ncbi:MAG: serine hydrolase [Flavobacteriales bacterium]|nr:serine hydrolase [Flavobacteriales bacterium]
MKSTISSLALILLSLTLISQANYSEETLKKISEVESSLTTNLVLNGEPPATIPQRMAEYNVKGMSIAVINDYKIVWAKGYGWADEAAKIPVTTETLFEPGSISKTLNALGILKLAQEKKVDLNTDINTYLTSWKFPYDSLSDGKKITLSHLLSHTAGLTVHGFPGHGINDPKPTIYQVLNGDSPSFTPAVRSMYAPGLQFEYSGGGTSIAQVILTDVTRQVYESWMYENVLKPIGMIHSTYEQPPSKEMQRLCASAYRGDGTPVEDRFHVYPEQAAAGLWMTPSDLCQYIIDMQLAYKGQPSKVLSDEMVKLHLTPYNNGPTALGTFIQNYDGALYFEHGAGNDGFCGQFYGSLEDGNGVVVFLNSEDGKILGEVINSVAKVYKWKNFYQEPRHKKTIHVSEEVIETYHGIYLYDNTWAAIGKKDGRSHFFTNNMYVDMHFITPTLFVNREFQAEKEMIKDEMGAITGYTRVVNGKAYPKSTKVTDLNILELESNLFAEITWYLFETKEFEEAIGYYKRAILLYPEDLNMKMNMAHAYLFKGDYSQALAIYNAHLGEIIHEGLSWEDSMRSDFRYFKENHYDTSEFEKVFHELKVSLPEGK